MNGAFVDLIYSFQKRIQKKQKKFERFFKIFLLRAKRYKHFRFVNRKLYEWYHHNVLFKSMSHFFFKHSF